MTSSTAPTRTVAAPARAKAPPAPDDTVLRRSAVSALLANWRSSSTVPAASLYPHQWSWDSAFIAVGLAHVSTRRAWSELGLLLGAQWRDGRIPQIVFNRAVEQDAYFPGPGFWRPLPPAGPPPGVWTSGLVQPPVHAIAALELLRRSPREQAVAALRRLYPRLAASHDYHFTRRTVANGLVAVVHPWETGLDNSPAWDQALRAVGADRTGVAELRRDVRAGRRAHRPTDEDYARYVGIATAYRDRGYSDSDLSSLPFCVLDPLTNAVLAAAERALGELAAALGLPAQRHVDRADALERSVHEHLYDARLGCYVALDARTGAHARVRTVGGLVPLLLPGLPRERRAALLGTLTGPAFRLGDDAVLGVASYDLAAPDFDRQRYWRGPTWMNTNWLILRGLERAGEPALADHLARSMRTLVAREGFREYFDPLSGEGLGAASFSWSAALALDVMARSPAPRR